MYKNQQQIQNQGSDNKNTGEEEDFYWIYSNVMFSLETMLERKAVFSTDSQKFKNISNNWLKSFASSTFKFKFFTTVCLKQLNPGVGNPPGHYLCKSEPGRPVV